MLVHLAALLVLGLLPNGTVDDLKKGSVVRISLGEQRSLIGEVIESNDESVTCLDLETLEPVEISRSEISSVRDDVSQALIFERAGVGRWLGWQLRKQFEDASTPQTIASIQQASIFVTANRASGLMVGDEVYAYRLGEPIKDPTTGEILDTPEQKIAQLEVMEVSEKIVTCRPKGEFSIELKIGDVVRPALPRSSVAVLPITNTNGNPTKSGVLFCGQVTDALTTLGIETLERERLVSVLNEQLFQLNVSSDEAARIGKLLGAATLVTGTISRKPTDPQTSVVSIRLLDVRTGQVIKTLEAELLTKDVDMGLVDHPSLLSIAPANNGSNRFPVINSFKNGTRSAKFTVPADATKVEIAFVVRVSGRHVALRTPGSRGKLVVNSTVVVQDVGGQSQERDRSGRTSRAVKFFDGTKPVRLEDRRGTIDITSIIKKGQENTVTYTQQAENESAVVLWITE